MTIADADIYTFMNKTTPVIQEGIAGVVCILFIYSL